MLTNSFVMALAVPIGKTTISILSSSPSSIPLSAAQLLLLDDLRHP